MPSLAKHSEGRSAVKEMEEKWHMTTRRRLVIDIIIYIHDKFLMNLDGRIFNYRQFPFIALFFNCQLH